MIWLAILALAGLGFLAAAFLFGLARSGWTLFGAALLFGLTGYALQGSPGQPASPGAGPEQIAETGELMVQARREFYDPETMPSRYVVSADAFARRGQYEDAANFLRNAVAENPRDDEAWVALGNVLVEHAQGQLSAAALFAYARAEELAGDNPAPGYFVGLAMLRQGEFAQGRRMWAEIVAEAPEDAPWRPVVADRLERLDLLLSGGGMPPAPAPALAPAPR
jgi:cytochrome c-type biogenesis protein CcmH